MMPPHGEYTSPGWWEHDNRRRVVLLLLSGAILGCALTAPLLLVGAPWWFLVAGPLAGLTLGATRLRPLLWTGAGATALLVFIVAFTPVVEQPLRSIVRADPAGSEPADAAVVLSEGVTREGMIPSSAVNRLLSGIRVLRAGEARALVVMGVSMRYGSHESFSKDDQRRLLGLIEPRVPVHFVPLVLNTREEALATAALAREHGWRRVIVVTAPTHTRRACATFEAAGLAVRCIPADARDGIPSEKLGPLERLRGFHLLGYETAASVKYRARGWIGKQ